MTWAALMSLLLLLSVPAWSAPQAGPVAGPGAKATAEAPKPGPIFKQMCDLLQGAPQFSFKAEVTDDRVYRGGLKLQFALDLEVFAKRPDKLRINATGDLENKEFFYDGKTITLFDQAHKAYAATEAPATIDAALDRPIRNTASPWPWPIWLRPTPARS
jgi:hypothetical protein